MRQTSSAAKEGRGTKNIGTNLAGAPRWGGGSDVICSFAPLANAPRRTQPLDSSPETTRHLALNRAAHSIKTNSLRDHPTIGALHTTRTSRTRCMCPYFFNYGTEDCRAQVHTSWQPGWPRVLPRRSCVAAGAWGFGLSPVHLGERWRTSEPAPIGTNNEGFTLSARLCPGLFEVVGCTQQGLRPGRDISIFSPFRGLQRSS